MSLINRFREWRASQAEHRAAADEMQFHILQETERNIRMGMTPEVARREATVAFGGIDRFVEAARDERTGTRLSDFKASWLDWKLGGRMLLKYPGLSIIGGVTLAAAMALAAGWFEFSWELKNTKLPFAQGDRIVRIENWDAAAGYPERRSAYDFDVWREQVKSLELFGAYRNVERNLRTGDGHTVPQVVAEISANAFPLTGVPPLLGRPLTDADAEPGAPDVVVVGYDLWQKRFTADPAIIGRTVQLGRTTATVVGVMPDGFGFPVNHQMWAPLRLAQAQPRSGPAIRMFGRLAGGATLEKARAELAAIGTHMAEANPATHAQLRPQVVAYAASSESLGGLVAINLVAWLVLAIAGANVATLMFARTALRESEIVVRNALGASRMRVMGQLFVESLVLSLVAAVVGLFVLDAFFDWASTGFGGRSAPDAPWPFWRDLSLGPVTILYTVALAVFGAVMVGLLPAIRATGTRVQASLRNIGSSGTSMQLGGMWTVLIVLQVALSVIGLPMGIAQSREHIANQRVRSAFDSKPYLTFKTDIDPEAEAGTTNVMDADELAARRAGVINEFERRLENEPEVAAVTFADNSPGGDHPWRRIEVQRGNEAPALIDTNIGNSQVGTSVVDIGFFDAFDMPLITGRQFHKGDVGAANGVVIVNEALARNLGGNPIGTRIRTVAANISEEKDPWLEVVGVVGNLGLDPTTNGEQDFMFSPADFTTLAGPGAILVRVHDDATAFEPRVRAIAAQVAPDLRLYDVLPLAEVIRRGNFSGLLMTSSMVGVALLVLVLSAAGLFALMSVAVARRTREIGIRLAIGASPRAVLGALFKRAATQVGAGLLIGNILVVLLLTSVVDDLQVTAALAPMLTASLIMTVVGMCACLVPARRALKVQPTEALKGAR